MGARVLSATAAELNARVLRTLDAVMDEVGGTPLLDRHVQRREHQISRHLLADRPSDDTPAPYI
jgi:hypothetical protein